MKIKRYHVWAIKVLENGALVGDLFQIGTGRTPEDIAVIATRRLIPRGMSDYQRLGNHMLWLQVEDEDGFRSLHSDMMLLWTTARYSSLGKREARDQALLLTRILLERANAWTFPPLEIGYLAYQSITRAHWLPKNDRNKWVWHTTSSFAEASWVTRRPSSSRRIAARRGGRYYNSNQLRELQAHEALAHKAPQPTQRPTDGTELRRELLKTAGEGLHAVVTGRVIGYRDRYDNIPVDLLGSMVVKAFELPLHFLEVLVAFTPGTDAGAVWVPFDAVRLKDKERSE